MREASMVSHERPLSINVIHEDGSLVLALAGELDVATRPVLQQAVGELISPHLQAVTLDLGGIDFADVTGLRALLDVKEMADGIQAAFLLRSVRPRTHRVIGLAEFDDLEAAIHRDAVDSDA